MAMGQNRPTIASILSDQRRRPRIHNPAFSELPSLNDIKKAPMGRVAIDALVAAGAEPKELEHAVRLVIQVYSVPRFRIQDVAGFTRKSLALFPQELLRTAVRIELVRRNRFYEIVLGSWGPTDRWVETCANLRALAAFLHVFIRVVRENAARDPQRYDFRLFSKRLLIETVSTSTGRPHFNRLAELLNAAYYAAGLELREEASALRHLSKRQLKK